MNSTPKPSAIRNRLLPAVLLVVLCLASGCLEFEEQTVTYAYDAKTDTLRIFQNYHGIFGVDQPDRLSSDEQDQLKSVLNTQRTFFFANWIFEFHREQLEKNLSQIQTAEGRKEFAAAAESYPKLEALLRLLLDNVRVENGACYFDSKRRLSAVQRVTVSRASKLVAALNDWLPYLLRAEAAKEDTSAALRAVYEKAASQGRPLVSLRGNEVTLRWPLPREEYDKEFGAQTDGGKSLELFRQRGGRASFADNEMIVSLGSPSEAITSLTLPMSKKSYVPNALEAVKQRATVLEKFDAPAAARAFLKVVR